MMNELLPVLSGLVVGGSLGLCAPRKRPRVAALASVVLGLLATVVSGEYAVSWGYLLVDVPLVAVSAAAGAAATRSLLVRAPHHRLPD